MEVKTMKVQPWGEGQGDFVVINEADFDPAVHTAIDAAPPAAKTPPAGPTAAELKDALKAKGIPFKGNASKEDLQALLDAAPPAETDAPPAA